jgi:site-specific DNA-methyltransferase (adenine-specific)
MLNQCTENDEIATPKWFFDGFAKKYDIIFDVCATSKNSKCERYLTRHENALNHNWGTLYDVNSRDQYLWCNPPYSRGNISAFAQKIIMESILHAVRVLVLCRLDNTIWHGELLHKCAVLYIPNFKLKFENHKNGSTFPVCVMDINSKKLLQNNSITQVQHINRSFFKND